MWREADKAFDAMVPVELRHLSLTHWTPVGVAIRTVDLLRPESATRILDVGSGVGKLCAIGALAGEGMWCGVEQHRPLVAAAERLAFDTGVGTRTKFFHGDALSLDWNEFDVLYFYNPFELAIPGVDRAASERNAVIDRVQQRLARLPQRTRVVTFHGFGGAMPPSFDLEYQERFPGLGLDLAVWTQRTRRCRSSRPS